MRQFNLTNANGQVFDLMRKDAFFNTPEGLGWGVTDTIMQVDKAYIVTESVPNTPAPAGEMLLPDTSNTTSFSHLRNVAVWCWDISRWTLGCIWMCPW